MSSWTIYVILLMIFLASMIFSESARKEFVNCKMLKILSLGFIILFPIIITIFGNYHVKIIKDKYSKPMNYDKYENFIDQKSDYKTLLIMIKYTKGKVSSNEHNEYKKLLKDSFL